LRKNTKTILTRDLNNKSLVRIDELDLKIISLLVSGRDNKQISKELKVPLSTVQRRTRMILAKDIVKNKIEPNYKKLGYNKGMIHASVKSSDVSLAAQKLAEIDGIISVAVHLGTSDIVAEFVYGDSTDVLETISKIWNIEGIDRVTWSQEVYAVPVHNKNVISALP
jgi:Lrp/AsnC family transcriptional regulator for asnA, asnC and gidA